MPGKKQVRLAFCDLAPVWDARDNYFTQALEHAGWEITFCIGPEEKPDFVLCGTFGFDFLKYDCCRIQFSGEDSWPDLNLYDYAMGFEVLDRARTRAPRPPGRGGLCSHHRWRRRRR